jgi:hypothetical protein
MLFDKEEALSPRPLLHYPSPLYPTRLQVLDDPDLLRRHLPPGWLQSAEMAGAVAFLLAANGSLAAAEDAKQDSLGTGGPIAIVAPIFAHGEGRGSTGCMSVVAPVFLSEEEAMQVIGEELRKSGVHLHDKGVVWEDVRIGPRHRIIVVKRGEEHSAGSGTIREGEAHPFAVDGWDAKKRVGVEFVSQSDWGPLGGVGSDAEIRYEGDPSRNGWMTSTASGYDLKAVAERVAEKVREQKRERIYFGTFYDPAAHADPTARMSEQRRVAGIKDPKKHQKSREELDRKEESEARKMSIDLLRDQVKDFVDWLKAQGAI